jgi:hypothetical protein
MLATRRRRFLAYGAGGLVGELAYTALAGAMPNGNGWRSAHTSVWMFPVYGLIAPLYEPLKSMLRRRGVPAPARAAAYCAGFTAIEYGSGRAMRRGLGEAPWDYSHARLNLHGLIRASYAPLWAGVGLALEPVTDRLAGRA